MSCTSHFNSLKKRQYEIANFVGLYQSLFINLPLIRRMSPDFESKDARDAFQELLKSANTFDQFVTVDRFRKLYLDLYTAQAVDSFQYYLQRVITDAYSKRPEALKSSKKIKIREVIDALQAGDSISDLVGNIIVRQVESLSYKSLDDFAKHLKKEHNIDLDRESEEFRGAEEIVAVRNIIVHNDRKVNQKFLRSTGRTDLEPGEDFPLDPGYITERLNDLESVARQADEQVVEGFGLPTEDEITWESIVGTE